jgi:dolichyl-phosphate beta-glucosyltransferase
MPSIAIIVPCYNEAKRLLYPLFVDFANRYSHVFFVFVNDGSTDSTQTILEKIKENTPNTAVISYIKNEGKGEAVRKGLVYALNLPVDYVGYIDADLSTSLEEFYRLFNLISENDIDFVLASRIKKLDTVIERSFSRHIIGRLIATLIDKKFKLGIYDTQCGAKIFKCEMVSEVISKPFWTRWFFDVEMLVRIKHINRKRKGAEVPLQRWYNKRNSKITILSFPVIIKDLFYLLIIKY